MYYELYIDVLFLTNFFVDSILLLTVRKVLRFSVPCSRVYLGAAVGSILFCLVTVLSVPLIWKLVLSHVFVNSAMVIIGLKAENTGRFFRALGVLYISAFLLGGIQYAFASYVHIGSLFFAVSVTAYYALGVCWKTVIKIRDTQRRICEVDLYSDEGICHLRALVDTGNLLTDPLSGDPVSVLEAKKAGELFPDKEGMPTGLRYISYQTVAGRGVMPVLRLQKMRIRFEKEFEIKAPLIGICDEMFSVRGEYQMILNAGLLQEKDENRLEE